jgi:hypothetical protein
MIQLNLSQDDLLKYLDTEELQRSAEYQVKETVRNEVSKLLKEEDTLKEIISKIISKVVGEDIEFQDKIKNTIKERILSTAEGLDEFTYRWKSGMDEIIAEASNNNKPEIYELIQGKIVKFMSEYEVDRWNTNAIITEMTKNIIMENEDKFKVRERLENFISNNVEKMLDQFAEQ